MDAPTIAQVTAAAPGDLGTFLKGLPATQEAQIFYALMGAGSAGMAANWVTRWTRGEIGNLFQYLFNQNARATVGSFLTFAGTGMAAIYAHAFNVGPDSLFVGWGMVLWLGAVNGFAIDNIVNKGQRPVWTAEQRAAKATEQP